MGHKKQAEPEILHCPVAFGTVSNGDTTARVPLRIDRENITLEQADALLCERRLTGRLVVLPANVDPDQQSFPGMDEKHELVGVFDTRGFAVKKKRISSGATFAIDTIDCGELHYFAKRSGRLIVTEAAEIPEPEKEEPAPASVPKVGGPWRKAVIDQIGLNPNDAAKLKEADILTAGDLQDRMTNDGTWWSRHVQGIGEAGKDRIEEVFNAFVIENDVEEPAAA